MLLGAPGAGRRPKLRTQHAQPRVAKRQPSGENVRVPGAGAPGFAVGESRPRTAQFARLALLLLYVCQHNQVRSRVSGAPGRISRSWVCCRASTSARATAKLLTLYVFNIFI